MWEQLAKWNNHFLQRELKDLSAIRISEMTNNGILIKVNSISKCKSK